MIDSGIGWTQDTYTPIRVKGGGFYCVKISEGCKFCYAETYNARWFPGTHVPYKQMDNPPELELRRDVLDKWKRKTKTRLNFIESMSDMFGEFVPKEWTFEMLDAMVAAYKQIFQVLTKREDIMRDRVNEFCDLRGIDCLPENIWMIVSVENQERLIQRIPPLMQTRCKMRGISAEPLLGPLDLTNKGVKNAYSVPTRYENGKGIEWTDPGDKFIGLNWVITGGESSQRGNYRPSEVHWYIDIILQCIDSMVPVFMKQTGTHIARGLNLKSGAGSDMSEWPACLQIQEKPLYKIYG